jgi:hypothetical protein
MSNAVKRAVLRWIHLVFTIPILGYIYQPPSEVAPYADGVRYLFLPIMMLSGYWMYAGVIFAVIGVALWLGAFWLFGFGVALLSQVALFVARKIWLMARAK